MCANPPCLNGATSSSKREAQYDWSRTGHARQPGEIDTFRPAPDLFQAPNGRFDQLIKRGWEGWVCSNLSDYRGWDTQQCSNLCATADANWLLHVETAY
jgi:hypothetical protein